MNAYVPKEELALLPANRLSYPEHYAEDHQRRHPTRPGLFARVAAWRRRQRAYGELFGLSDRELQDIGLNRADIRRVFEPGFEPSWR